MGQHGKAPSGSDVLTRSTDELLTTRVDGELIGMSIEQGTCYGFNAVGTRVWDLLAEPRTLDSLCAQLADEYDVDDAECRRDVLALIAELQSEDLVTVSAA